VLLNNILSLPSLFRRKTEEFLIVETQTWTKQLQLLINILSLPSLFRRKTEEFLIVETQTWTEQLQKL
jgi:transcriptional antiterminator Rof (Rho-off)